MPRYFKLARFFLYLVPLTVIIVTPSTLFPFIVGKYAFFRTTVFLALICFLLGLLFQPENVSRVKPHRNPSPNYNKPPLNYHLIITPLAITVAAFVLIFLLACLFGTDPKMSFWSNFERGEGGLQILCLGIFFALLVILFREEKDWQKLFWFSVLAASLVIFYGVGAHLKYLDAEMTTRVEGGFEVQMMTGRGGPYYQTFKNFIGGSFNEPHFRFSGSLGNPAYTATYLVFALFYAGYLLVSGLKAFRAQGAKKDDLKAPAVPKWKFVFSGQSWFLGAVMIFFFVFFWLAATRGAFMGLIAAVFGGMFCFIYQYKKWRKPMLVAAGLLLLAIILLIHFRDTAFISSLPGSRLFDITVSAETWRHRTYMWKAAIDGWRERPLFGWGPENFSQIFIRHFNPNYFDPKAGFTAWFDRAHSVFFDYLSQTGGFGLLAYLSVFAVFYLSLIKMFRSPVLNHRQLPNSIPRKNADDKLLPNYPITQSLIINTLLFALPIAYLVQGIVLFEILPLYLNLFLFLAFAAHKLRNKS